MNCNHTILMFYVDPLIENSKEFALRLMDSVFNQFSSIEKSRENETG